MSTIAKGMITLSSLNDAFNVSLSPNSCVIHADFDGTNPKLDGAYTNVTITRGDTPVKFNIKLHATSNQSVQYDIVDVNEYTQRIKLKAIPSDILSGFLEFEIQSLDDFFANITFQFTVVRESTMLDWIQDWENNKTTIGSTYMITPKIFVGKKIMTSEDLKSLSGVYIGPDSINGAGVYGYVDGAEIFHLNQNGGLIGGWKINNGGIQTLDGKLKILSEGSILSHGADNNIVWGLYKTGDAVFANGNVKMFANGNAEFIGTIKTKAGEIGGWSIKQGYLHSNGIRLDAIKQKISVFASAVDDSFAEAIETVGGVEMFFDSSNSYGISCYLPAKQDNQLRKSFSLGSSNYIAGWMFDDTAIWLGSKLNTAKQYTSQEGSITIGTAGLRGNSWYIDSNGDFSLMAGKINFSASQNGGDIVGWKLNNNRLSTDKVAIVSDGSVTGIYLTASSNSNFNSLASTALGDAINTNGGICLNVNSDSAELRAHNSTGQRLFQLKSNGTSYIASWEFDKDAIYTGVKVIDFSKFSNAANCITLSPNGLVGFKWRLLADGSGALANGNISWTTAGAVTFSESVKINWSNLGGTIIDGNGIFAGKISANNITAGTISTANIKNSSGTWYLNQDGSGALANGNISWTTAGVTTFTGKIIANSGKIGDIEIYSDHIGTTASAGGDGGADWANLSIYKDFFKVGGGKGYVMFGNDVIPSSFGGAFTAVGRIVNKAYNSGGIYGFDQANYGLLIDVTGGTKNYGVDSNAALRAPAFINTKAKILTFSGSGYSLDFSQHNIILMYYNEPNYSGTIVTLPSEFSVAKSFGVSSLPSDFATIVTFRVRTGSKNITLKGIYNHNEDSADYLMASGDSVTLLITKVDGFRYQIINHTY